MYKAQYLNINRNKTTFYGNNVAYLSKTHVIKNGYKWDAPEKKINKSGRHFLK